MAGLFDDFTRTDRLPAREAESSFDFLNRHDSGFFQRVRELLEDWWGHLPVDERAPWKSAFQSRDERVTVSAFWELYLHETFLRTGCTVEIHPHVEGTNRRPDFLVRCGGDEFYVEATLLGASDKEVAEQRRRDGLYQTLQGLDSPDFFLMIDIGFREGPRAPPGRRFRKALEQWIPQHRWEALRPIFEREGAQVMPATKFEAAGWTVPFRLLPKPAHLRGDPSVRPLGVYGAVTSVTDPIETMRRPLREKSTRYGLLPRPYMIAVLDPIEPEIDHGDADGALYGRTTDEFGANAGGNPVHIRTYRKTDGFWQPPPNAQNTRVSGVLIASNIRPWSVTTQEPELWLNPWAAQPLRFTALWGSHLLNPGTDEIERRLATRGAADVFGLPRDWPGPDDPFR